MTSLSLSFRDTTLDVIMHHQKPWISSRQLGQMLGYAREDVVNKVFERKADEFSSGMTCNVKMTLQGQTREIRVFSLRGCHLIAMFAKTPIAKEFRKWVLDVLENEIQHQQIDTRVKINAEQQAVLKEIVDRRCEGSVKKRTELWARHNKHFRIPRYSELLAIHFQDAVNYLEAMQIKAKGSIHIDENQSIEMLCVHAKFFRAWWDTHSPALAKLNPLLISMLHDNMFSMSYAISDICKKYNIDLPAYDYKHMFELQTLPHQRFTLLK